MHYRWEGEGVSEVGKNKATGEVLVRVNPRFYRPTEVVSTFGLRSGLIAQSVVGLIADTEPAFSFSLLSQARLQ